MKYFIISLILTSFVAFAPQSFGECLSLLCDPDPLDLWNSSDVIIDGTVIEVEYTNSQKDTNIPNYHIKVNKYFKGDLKTDLVFAKNDLYASEFTVNDNGLFYLQSSNDVEYVVQPHSLKTFGNCSARDLIEIIPVLPNEKFPISMSIKSENYFDSCVADYFTYDPDFFVGIINGIPPLQQIKHGLPNDMIRCYDDLTKITKYDDSIACVKESSALKLIEREWAKNQCAHLFDVGMSEYSNHVKEQKEKGVVWTPTTREGLLLMSDYFEAWRNGGCINTINNWKHLSDNTRFIKELDLNKLK